MVINLCDFTITEQFLATHFRKKVYSHLRNWLNIILEHGKCFDYLQTLHATGQLQTTSWQFSSPGQLVFTAKIQNIPLLNRLVCDWSHYSVTWHICWSVIGHITCHIIILTYDLFAGLWLVTLHCHMTNMYLLVCDSSTLLYHTCFYLFACLWLVKLLSTYCWSVIGQITPL